MVKSFLYAWLEKRHIQKLVFIYLMYFIVLYLTFLSTLFRFTVFKCAINKCDFIYIIYCLTKWFWFMTFWSPEEEPVTELHAVNTDFTFELFMCATILLENRDTLLRCRNEVQLIQFTSRCVCVCVLSHWNLYEHIVAPKCHFKMSRNLYCVKILFVLIGNVDNSFLCSVLLKTATSFSNSMTFIHF